MSPTSCQTAPPRNRGANYRGRRPQNTNRARPTADALIGPLLRRADGGAGTGAANTVDVALLDLQGEQVVAHLCLVVALLGLEARAHRGVFHAVEDDLAALLGLESRRRLECLVAWLGLAGVGRALDLVAGNVRRGRVGADRSFLRKRG